VKRVLVLVSLALLAPILQGALAPFLPWGTCPDFGLLVVVGLGLSLRNGVGGLALAAEVGFVSDLLSGSLLGEHALLRMVAFALARLASLHVNLHGTLMQMSLAAGLSALSAAGILALTAFFSSGTAAVLVTLPDMLRQAAVNALFAPLLISAVARLVARLGDEDGRRVLRLEPRRGFAP
jgi:rod shape-determining protein MreD